jgi:DUF4097 and DUF4098 domain-containing protein YvlB
MKTAHLALALLLAAVVAAGCDVRVSDKGGVSLDINEGGRAEDESTKTYPLAKGGRIELQTQNGSVELIKATGAGVEVHARRQVRGKTDEEAQGLLKEQSFTVETAPDRVTIRNAKPEGLEGFRRRIRTDYRISVPVGAIVSIKNENGSVTLNDVAGHFTISLTNGRIDGRRVSGGFVSETVNATVILQLASVTDNVRVTTVNGHALIGLPPNLNATVEASAVNGGVIVREGLTVETATKDRQRLSGRLGTGSGPRIELNTTNGNVRLGAGEPPT